MDQILYRLFLLVLKIKGIKKHFQKNPIDYQSLRKDDVIFPSSRFFKTSNVKRLNILKSEITVVSKNSENVILYLHGGAFVSGPVQHHWNSIKKISNNTDFDVWMCNYPKSPEHQIVEISENIDEVYETILTNPQYKKIVLMGDSAGGNLIVALVQRLIEKNKKIPTSIMLISPVVDSSMQNPKIHEIENQDKMLSTVGVKSAKQMCAGEIDLKNPIISPLFGSFHGFPKTYLFVAEYDITNPDQFLLQKKLEEAKVEVSLFFGERMPHIWVVLPVLKEAKIAFEKIIAILKRI